MPVPRGISLTILEEKLNMTNASDFMVSFSPSLTKKLTFVPISTYAVGKYYL